jgi:hypothetical protein
MSHTVKDADRDSFFPQATADGSPNSATAAGYDRYFAFETTHADVCHSSAGFVTWVKL